MWGLENPWKPEGQPASCTLCNQESVSSMEREDCHPRLSWPIYMYTVLTQTCTHPIPHTMCPYHLNTWNHCFPLESAFEFLSFSLVFAILTTNLPDRIVRSFSFLFLNWLSYWELLWKNPSSLILWSVQFTELFCMCHGQWPMCVWSEGSHLVIIHF